jgi:hypothetical protein
MLWTRFSTISSFDLSASFDQDSHNCRLALQRFFNERGADLMSEAVTQCAPSHIPAREELGFDPQVLRERYAAERAGRLRANGISTVS